MSEIQDKGDLFYVEPYVDGSGVIHSNGYDKQTVTNGQLHHKETAVDTTKDKRPSGNKLLDLIPRMKKNKKSSDLAAIHNNGSGDKNQDINGEKEVRKDIKLRVNPPRIGPYKRDDLESVLGIIPVGSKFLAANENGELGNRISQDRGRDSKIVIAGFTPTGPAIASHELEIGMYQSLRKL